jgi:hypothetical protein
VVDGAKSVSWGWWLSHVFLVSKVAASGTYWSPLDDDWVDVAASQNATWRELDRQWSV